MEIDMLNGEKDVMMDVVCTYFSSNVKDLIPIMGRQGKMTVTTYRLRFLPDFIQEKNETHISHEFQDRLNIKINEIIDFKNNNNLENMESLSYFNVPLGCINQIERKANIIKIQTKDFRKFRFLFSVICVEKVYDLITAYVFPEKITYLFAFHHRLPKQKYGEVLDNLNELYEPESDWDCYIQQNEWIRQGILDNINWRITKVNHDFKLIDTYPEELVVPSCITDEELIHATEFRALGRIPCLSWMNSSNGAVICRCSQPKIGMSKATSESDENLVAAIASAASNSVHSKVVVRIIDCRPMSNAIANRAKGYGVESSANYTSAFVSFMNIPNIHTVRDSLKKLHQLSSSTTCDNLQWLGSLEDTKWLYHIRLLLKASINVTEICHKNGESVLVHCSHGWDRTSQVVALAQLLLDPYFRTIKGFQILIEKEWLAFGHPFQLRTSHGEKANTQESPVFIQFLDCVWQILRLYPHYFEFNEILLILLADGLHSCRFGTFLLDSRQSRLDAKLKSSTTSIWTWINGYRDEMLQLKYENNKNVLLPPLSYILRNVNIWADLHLRWSSQCSMLHTEQEQNNLKKNYKRNSNWKIPENALRYCN